MHNLSKFMISDTQYLKIDTDNIDKDDCLSCIDIGIDYVDEKNNINIRFGYDDFESFVLGLAECLDPAKPNGIQALFNNQAFLDKNIMGEPGIELNNFFMGYQNQQEKTFDFYFLGNSHKHVLPYYNSWLFNDKNGNIIFEITPDFPRDNATEEETEEETIAYQKFLKEFKPIVHVIIPKENLRQWITQAQQLKKEFGLETF